MKPTKAGYYWFRESCECSEWEPVKLDEDGFIWRIGDEWHCGDFVGDVWGPEIVPPQEV